MSEEGNANSPVQMAADVPGSPVCPRKITLADFINVKRCNPHVNFNLNSRALTPHSGVTSVHGSTWDNDVQSINAEKNTPTSRRHSSRTNYSSDDDADEGQDKAQNTKRKRAVFACDGHGKRESRWKSESIRRIRLSTLIQKSRESSAKTGRASEFDPFNDSQSGYSFDMASRSTRHHPTSGDSKWSRRERASRGDTSHRRKRRQSLGESRACQTSPISFPDTDEHRPSVEEVKAQPIKEAEEEFDYPLSQLLLEYPYNPNANGVEIKTTQRATEIRSQTIDIRVPGSNSGEEKVYDANGTIIIVTASSVIDDGKMESHTEQGGNGESIHGSDQGKHDTDSRTIDKKDEHFPSSETNDHPNDKSIVNDPNPANPDSQNNALCIDGDNLETTSSSSSALIADTGDTTTYMSLSDKTLLGFSPKEHTTDRPMDECRGCPTDSSETGTNSEIAQNIGINNETSCTSNSNEAPITEKELIAENEVIKEDSGDQVSTDKEIMAECANNIENSDSVSENDKTNDSSVTFHDKNKNVDVSPNKNIHADSPPDINIQINNFDHAETPNNVSSGDTCDEMKPEEKTETNPNKERKDESLEIQADGVKGTKASSINGENKMNRNEKPTVENSNEENKLEADLLETCKKDLSDEVQLGKAVLDVIQMWKDSAVVQSVKGKQHGRTSSSGLGDEVTHSRWSNNSSRVDRKDNTESVKPRQKEIQIVIRNPGRKGVSKTESAVKIVIKLPDGSNSPPSVSTSDVTEAKTIEPITEAETPENRNLTIPDLEPEQEEVPNPKPEEIPQHEPSPEVPEKEKEVGETRMLLPPITTLFPTEPDHTFNRIKHIDSGKKQLTPPLISIRKSTVTTASVRLHEVDGVFCSDKGVYIGHDRKLYNTFHDASHSSRVDQILENFKVLRRGNINKSEFLYDQDNDEVFQTHLDTFRRGNSRKSKINESVVFATSKLYSQARNRKAKAYSNLHKNLTSSVHY